MKRWFSIYNTQNRLPDREKKLGFTRRETDGEGEIRGYGINRYITVFEIDMQQGYIV